jgi:flagellar M-ring protein FliF
LNGKSFNQVLGQLQAFLKSLSTKQIVLLLMGGGIVTGVLWIFVGMANSVEYKTLYSNLDANEAQQIGAQLSSKNIPYQLSPDSTTLKVPSDQLDKVRVDLASQGLPQNGRLGFEIFDKPNWSGSDFAEKVNYQRALEGELERTIQTISGVDAARVHLVLPHESLFSDRDRKAKAAVVLRFRGRKLGDDSGRAIKFLVASAVDNLSAEDVTIVDAQGRSLLADEDTGTRRNEEMEKLLADKVVATLTPLVGQDKVKANVTVAYDLSSTEENNEIYDPKSAVAVTHEMSEERNGGTEPAGIPGTPSNIPGKTVQSDVAATVSSQSSKSDSATYAVNKIIRHTLQPAGRVQRITAAVLIDEDAKQKRTPEELKSIEDLTRAALGFDANRGDVIKVESVAFRNSEPEKLVPPALPVRVQKIVNDWSSALRYAAVLLVFLIVYMLVLRPVKNQIVAAFKSLPIPGGAKLAAAGASAEILEGSAESHPNAVLKKQLAETVRREPENASRLIQSWMREDGKERKR